MTVDYDLVVIGATPVGLHAAITAARLKARVALVTQSVAPVAGEIGHRVLLEVTHRLYQVEQAQQLGLVPPTQGLPIARLSQRVEQWQQAVTEAIAEQTSLAMVAAEGVELLDGVGAFYRKPVLSLEVKGRSLRSRRYLLALPGKATAPDVLGASEAGYLTPADLSTKLATLPAQADLIVIGSDATAAELSQALIQLGFQITLIVPAPRLLPEHDQEAATLIQAQLEADGVRVMSQVTVQQFKAFDGQKWVQAGSTALAANEIILSLKKQPQTQGLNLEAIGVSLPQGLIAADAKLRTANPQVYACTYLTNEPAPTKRHAEIAVQNALFAPWKSQKWRGLLRAGLIATEPAFAWVGASEAQARQAYGSQVVILRRSLSNSQTAQLRGETRGFCKLILRRNGQILGAAIVAAEAEAWIGAISLAIQHNLPLQKLAQVPFVSPSFAEILQELANDWQQHQRQRHPWRVDLLAGWFNWRRSAAKQKP